MEKPGIEPATPGLQGIALIHYTTGLTYEWTLIGYLKFPKFLCTLNFQNQLQNKPHLHIKGANKLKMRFIPLNFSGIC